MTQLELFPDYEIKDEDRLYVIGNGFDVHHCIDSKYVDFKEWLMQNQNGRLIGMMDRFFSNETEFWSEIEKALGEYNEESITEFCEPENDEDFKLEHTGQWQAGIEDSIPTFFSPTMNEFREAFDNWVRSIVIRGIEIDLQLPLKAKYLTFNYTETLESAYHIPQQNVLHIHGSRMVKGDVFVIGHGNPKEVNEPFADESLLLPYQNAYSEIISIMNEWTKHPKAIIREHKDFFDSLNSCKGVCVMGLSYNDIDMPYLKEVAASVAPDCKWWLYYYSKDDMKKAEAAAAEMGLRDYCLRRFE
jgi:hypothetical protein